MCSQPSGATCRNRVVDGPALAPQLRVGHLQILRVPEDDGRDQQVEPRGAEELVLKAAIADLAEPAEIDGTGQRVARFALVEPEMGAAAEVGVLDPIKREQRALDAADLGPPGLRTLGR